MQIRKKSEMAVPCRNLATVLTVILLAHFLPAPGAVAQEIPTASSTGADTRREITLTLPKAVEMAMQHNRHLALARLADVDSREAHAIAQSHYYPQVSSQSTATYLTDLQGVVIPAGAFGNASGPIPPQTIRLAQGAKTSYSSGTQLVQPLTQYFKIHAGDKAAQADVKTAEIEERDAENSISLLVHKLYFDILTAQAHLGADQESVKAAATTEQESTRAVAQGRSLDVVALESHAAFLDQERLALVVQLSIDDLMLQLDDVLGLPLGTKLLLDSDALGEVPAMPSRSDAITTIKEHNPKVLAARQAVDKADAAVSAARAAYIPDVSALARYNYQSGVPFLVHNFGIFGGIVTYDVFDGGAREAELKRAKIHLTMAQTQLEQTESDVSIEVASAYDKVEELRKLIAVASEALKTRAEASRISDKRLEQNADLASTVAKTHAAVYAARASALEAQLALFLAEANIQRLLGERP